MTAETKITYTEAQTKELVERYTAGETVETIAEALGKSVRSVVAKLSREGVYKAKTKAKGTARVTKLDLVKQLAEASGVEWQKLESLEKATTEALEILVARLG